MNRMVVFFDVAFVFEVIGGRPVVRSETAK